MLSPMLAAIPLGPTGRRTELRRSPPRGKGLRRTAPLAAGLLGLATLALPAWGAGRYGPVPLRPKDAELIEKSAEIGELLRRRGRVLEDGPEVELVRRVGESVRPESPSDDYQRFRFAVIRHPVPNAFALPDGQVYVHTGLLALLENEAQLAAVLAHETMHVEGHHSILNARQAREKVGWLRAFQYVLLPVSGASLLEAALADALIGRLVFQAIIGYGRELEEEADRRAISRVLAAGYDPREMPRAFELLDLDPEGERRDPKPKWSSHPEAQRRAAYTREILGRLAGDITAEEQRRGGLRVGEERFGERVQASAFDAVEQYVAADRPRMALYLAERAVERWPGEPRAQALLGDAWRALDARAPELDESELSRKQNRARAKERREYTRQEREQRRLEQPVLAPELEQNQERAEQAYREALALEPRHPAALRGLGYLDEDRGNDLEAGRWLARYLEAAPEASDRPVVLRHLREITERLQATGREGS